MDNQLTIKFGGDGNIRVETLTEFLDSYKSLLYLINNQFGHSSEDLIIEVSPPENGSFKIKLSPKYKELILNNIGNLLTGTFAGLLVVWITLPSGDNVTLKDITEALKKNTRENSEVLNSHDVYNIYQNIDARIMINNSFKVISNDMRVVTLKIEHNNEELINIPHDKFDDFIKPETKQINDVQDVKVDMIRDEVNLVIKTIHFEGGAKWGFIFRGYPIKASIKAPQIQQMLNNESFRRGDILKVLLSRKQTFDQELGTYIVDQNSYEIEEIIEHKSRDSDYLQTRIE